MDVEATQIMCDNIRSVVQLWTTKLITSQKHESEGDNLPFHHFTYFYWLRLPHYQDFKLLIFCLLLSLILNHSQKLNSQVLLHGIKAVKVEIQKHLIAS